MCARASWLMEESAGVTPEDLMSGTAQQIGDGRCSDKK